MTSGIYVTSYDAVRYCGKRIVDTDDHCYFEGDVEVFYDPEIPAEYWDCPKCGYEHESYLEGDDYE